MVQETQKLLVEKAEALSTYITNRHFGMHPDLEVRFGIAGKQKCNEDARFHLQFLAEALQMEHPNLYANYISWVETIMESRNIPAEDLYNNLIYVQESVDELLGKEYGKVVEEYISIAKEKLQNKFVQNKTFITEENPLKIEAEAYIEYLLGGNRYKAAQLIDKLVEDGVPVKDIYIHIFQASQYEIGLLWQLNKITVAHEHFCTAATQLIMSGLYPKIFSTEKKGKTMVACSVSGELHELGIRMVADFFEMDGWDTYYLGANMPDSQLIMSLKDRKADLLAISVTLPSHVHKAVGLINRIRADEEIKTIKIMVGGYIFLDNPDFWKKTGADGFAENAQRAVKLANNLLAGKNE